MTVPQTGSLFLAHKDGTITYWSLRRQEWIKHVTDIPLDDICSLNSYERDRLLAYFQHQRQCVLSKEGTEK